MKRTIILILWAALLYAQIPTSGLIGYWTLHGNANDSSVTGNNGTIQGALVQAVDRYNIMNGCYLFGNGYITTSMQYTNPTRFTLSAWFKTKTAQGGYLVGFANGATNASTGYDRMIFMTNAGKIVFGIWDNNHGDTLLGDTITSNLSCNDSVWHHVGATCDSGVISLYLDGQLKSTRTGKYPDHHSGYWHIGSQQISSTLWPGGPSSTYFAGNLDEVRLYSRALSTAEIRAIALVPALIPAMPDPTQNNRPLFSWHHLDSVSNYTIQISAVANFASLLVTTLTADTTYQMPADLPDGLIYWRVKSGQSPTYSSSDTLYIQPDSIPFLMRYNGAITVTPRPPLKWLNISNGLTYQINVSTSRTFATTLISSPIADTIYTPLADFSPGFYFWRVSSNKNYNLFSPVDSFIVPISTNADYTQKALPAPFSLTAFPNPFNRDIAFKVYGLSDNIVFIRVCDITGKTVRNWKVQNGGAYTISWDASNNDGKRLPSGIYMVQVHTAAKTLQQRILLVK